MIPTLSNMAPGSRLSPRAQEPTDSRPPDPAGEPIRPDPEHARPSDRPETKPVRGMFRDPGPNASSAAARPPSENPVVIRPIESRVGTLLDVVA